MPELLPPGGGALDFIVCGIWWLHSRSFGMGYIVGRMLLLTQQGSGVHDTHTLVLSSGADTSSELKVTVRFAKRAPRGT